MRKIILVLSLIFTFHQTYVFADTCDTETMKKLMKDANNIKINYETEVVIVENGAYLTDGGSPTLERTNFLIDIYNITDDIFVIASNDINNSKQIITYSDTNNGTYKLDTSENFNKLGTYTFDIYAKNETCKNEKLKSVDFKKPITNPYYMMDICKENLDIPLCVQFVTEVPNYINGTSINEYIKQYRETSTTKISTTVKENTDNKFINYIKANKKYYVIGFVIICIVLLFIVFRRRRHVI